ncbi:MAG TPA: pseudouridine synthase, partial [Candidatus Hydrogenedentes bacterium]|nr:pseudouridine synthase [Candidatus Hydrogenedentota bacterium]
IAQDVTPGTDTVCVDGRLVRPNDKVYVVLNKPEGTVTTAKDTHGRPTVLDCLKGVRARVFPVGRLDMDVEGVLLLTNDGELAYRLTHPRFEVEKVYLAWVHGCMKPETALLLEKGVRLDDGLSAPARAVILSAGQETTLLRLHLHEGRKREVKRMCAAVGYPVKTLHRVAFGNIQDKGLRPGEWRYLSEREIEGLRALVRL